MEGWAAGPCLDLHPPAFPAPGGVLSSRLPAPLAVGTALGTASTATPACCHRGSGSSLGVEKRRKRLLSGCWGAPFHVSTQLLAQQTTERSRRWLSWTVQPVLVCQGTCWGLQPPLAMHSSVCKGPCPSPVHPGCGLAGAVAIGQGETVVK